MKILAILLNPTIDQIYNIERFYVGGTFKVNTSKIYPVGKAISFSLGVSELYKEKKIVKVIACIGEDEIPIYSEFLSSYNIDFEFVSVKGKTRSNKTINDLIKRTTTHIREKGFDLTAKNLENLTKKLKSNVKKNNICVFCGSIPPNIRSNIYFDLINLCKSKKAICILDSNEQPLIEGIKSNPKIIKPNLLELSQILNDPKLNELDFSKIKEAMNIIIAKAKILLNKELEIILVTLGNKGAILISNNLILYGNVVVENPIDTVGSGDSFLAGFVLNYLKKSDLENCFKCAIACGAANTLTPGPGIFIKKNVENLLKKVEITKIT
ncbi:MAG TPA: hexose kinase [Candidatus Lokiarchaeia archaeon]